jgi:hypothetical protein
VARLGNPLFLFFRHFWQQKWRKTARQKNLVEFVAKIWEKLLTRPSPSTYGFGSVPQTEVIF